MPEKTAQKEPGKKPKPQQEVIVHVPLLKRFAETRSHTFMCVQRVSGALPLTSRGQFSRRRKLPEKQSGYLFALLAT